MLVLLDDVLPVPPDCTTLTNPSEPDSVAVDPDTVAASDGRLEGASVRETVYVGITTVTGTVNAVVAVVQVTEALPAASAVTAAPQLVPDTDTTGLD